MNKAGQKFVDPVLEHIGLAFIFADALQQARYILAILAKGILNLIHHLDRHSGHAVYFFLGRGQGQLRGGR